MTSSIDITKPADTGLRLASDIRALAIAAKSEIDNLQQTCFVIPVTGEAASLVVGTELYTLFLPYDFSLVKVKASVNTVSSSGVPTFDVKDDGSSVFSTLVSIDISENFSDTATIPSVLTAAPVTITKGSKITIDCTIAGTGTLGAKIYLIGFATGLV